ncbi:xylulose kinase-like [Harmonia axyridis]|uniref:xylulose kinase-like n=1 Tax=Harmonia axyridis TaxID=115357 RepID=UPI001E278C27|nr:xylulose kinase-like [Harmonia axyridis]
MVTESSASFLGLDLSTQQLKAVIVNENLEILHEETVIFETHLPEYRTNGGVRVNKANPHEITAPTIMWIKALDLLMDKLIIASVDFSKIAAISGTAQQHGSVYWQNGAEKTLGNLDSSNFLHTQLATSFSVSDSPTWMDSTTKIECRCFEEAVGGPENLARITGSRAYERFTGPQIARISTHRPETFKNSERISLVSSFLASLFLGRIAPIDYSDASGMNLMDLRTKKWHPQLLKLCGPDIEKKLGDPVPSCSCLGTISPYFVERYGFNEKCKVIACSGDNPSSLIGMGIKDDWLAVSLGTSDTLLIWLSEPKTVLNGHILCNPLDPNAYMAILCFKNGSLAREKIRNRYADKSWDEFNELLESTPRGNFGYLGLHFDVEEILIAASGEFRYNKEGKKLSKFSSSEIEIRAAIEGQFLLRRLFAEEIGFKIGKGTKILATGGASCNKSILQVLSDVFGCPVYTQDNVNSALIGAAKQALIGFNKERGENNRADYLTPKLVCEPYKNSEDMYGPMVQKLVQIVKNIENESKQI